MLLLNTVMAQIEVIDRQLSPSHINHSSSTRLLNTLLPKVSSSCVLPRGTYRHCEYHWFENVHFP